MTDSPYRKGDTVRILPEYQDEGDEDFVWVVVSDDNQSRVDIQPVNHPLTLKPVYTLRVDQVELVLRGCPTST